MAGSSPLSRRIHEQAVVGCLGERIIPALAGNTHPTRVRRRPRRDHPRSRGEYDHPQGEGIVESGSSPLSRGIPSNGSSSPGAAGIIPALAGNTTVIDIHAGSTQDHPRSRGEYRSSRSSYSLHGGSSPLSRGILPCRGRCWSSRGIIPALAGNTPKRPRRRQRGRDHPRSRGEYGLDLGSDLVEYGSSPLSRGIPGRDRIHSSPRRIIPALAGNTPGSVSPE